MEKYLKNPIILAIIVGAVVFVLMSYLYNPKPDKKTNKRKNKPESFFNDKRETSILVAAIAALGTWFLANYYLPRSIDVVDITQVQNNTLNNPLVNPPSTDQAGIVPGFPGIQTQPPDVVSGNVPGTVPAAPAVPVAAPTVPAPIDVTQPGIVPGAPVAPGVPTTPAVATAPTAPVPQLGGSAVGTMHGGLPSAVPNGTVPGITEQMVGPQRSYNVIGSGIDIPRNAIPRVMVDYQ